MIYNEIMVENIARMCIEYSSDPHNNQLYDDIVESCRNIAHQYLRKEYHAPKTMGKMVYQPYTGQGNIYVEKTIQGISTKGRRMNSVISKARADEIRKKNFALLIDNSLTTASMGLSDPDERTEETEATDILAKIAAISVIESNRKRVDQLDIIPYADRAQGPYNIHQYPYRRILLEKRKGTNRLDLALAKLLQTEWDRKVGLKQLVILSGGIPETGRRNLLDDIEVQEKTIQYLRHLKKLNVRTLYICLNTDEEVSHMRIGSHSPRSFVQKLSRYGIAAREIGDVKELPHALKDGFKEMLSCRTDAPIFDPEYYG